MELSNNLDDSKAWFQQQEENQQEENLLANSITLQCDATIEDDLNGFDLESFADGVVNKRCGYVRSLDLALDIIMHFERATTTKYVGTSNRKGFGHNDVRRKPHKILWELGEKDNVVVPFDGIPFIRLGLKVFECQHGPDRNLLKKKKYAEKSKEMPFKKRRVLKNESIKWGCPARISVSEISRFPRYKIECNSRKRRCQRSIILRKDLRQGPISEERRFYISLPSQSDHSGHCVGEMGGSLQRIDSLLVNKIYSHVEAGVKDIGEMQRLLLNFVENEMFHDQPLPSRNNKRFFPTLRTIKNHICNARAKMKEECDSKTVFQTIPKVEADIDITANGIDSDDEMVSEVTYSISETDTAPFCVPAIVETPKATRLFSMDFTKCIICQKDNKRKLFSMVTEDSNTLQETDTSRVVSANRTSSCYKSFVEKAVVLNDYTLLAKIEELEMIPGECDLWYHISCLTKYMAKSQGSTSNEEILMQAASILRQETKACIVGQATKIEEEFALSSITNTKIIPEILLKFCCQLLSDRKLKIDSDKLCESNTTEKALIMSQQLVDAICGEEI